MADRPMSDSEIQAQWARVRGRLKEEFGEAAFRGWLRSMTLMEVSNGCARIGVPTRLRRDWITNHYADRIRALWKSENPAIIAVAIFVGGPVGDPADPPEASPSNGAAPALMPRGTPPKTPFAAETPAARPKGEPAAPTEPVIEDKGEIGAALDPRFTFENFIVGK